MATHASGTSVRMSGQCSVMCAVTPGAWTTAAMGNTMAAEIAPWTAPDSTLAMATSQIGHGAWTRSSISRVKPNSCAMASAIDWTPWNMIEMPTTPGTSTVANAGLGAAPGAADALADLREHEQEDEAEQKRLDERAQDELADVLAQHDEVTQ